MTQKAVQRRTVHQTVRTFFFTMLRLAIRDPLRSFSFLRTLLWIGKAARRRAKWKRQGYHIPPIIIFSVTDRCNLQCTGCYARHFRPESDQELSGEKLRSITEEASELGISFFVIAGGEPFMRPEMMDIMRDFPKIIFLVFTNGLLIDDDMILRLKKQRNVVPLVSIEGRADATDARRGEGTYAQLIETMAKMKARRIFFGNSIALTRANFSAVADETFIKELVSGGCKFLLVQEYTPVEEGTENLVLTEDQRSSVPDLLNGYQSKYAALFMGVPWVEERVGGCLSAGRGFVHISAKGDLEPCPFAPYSDTNVRDMSLKDALQSEFCKAIRQKPELAQETGGGCVLWKERETVEALLRETQASAASVDG